MTERVGGWVCGWLNCEGPDRDGVGYSFECGVVVVVMAPKSGPRHKRRRVL